MRLKWDSDTGPYPRLEFVDFYLGIINVKILGFKLFEKIRAWISTAVIYFVNIISKAVYYNIYRNGLSFLRWDSFVEMSWMDSRKDERSGDKWEKRPIEN